MSSTFINITGSGTIGNIPVTPGRYTKRAGDNDTLYRQDLSDDPTTSKWQKYINGDWQITNENPTE
jgi:hypothetical protein